VTGVSIGSLGAVMGMRGGGDSDEGGDSASIQYMVTRKMRAVLVEDLNYTDGEVDEMEPQIARVVIERRLQRPSKGMPSSWRRQGEGYGVAEGGKRFPNPFSTVLGMVEGIISQLSRLRKVPTIVKVACVPLLVLFSRERLPEGFFPEISFPKISLPELPSVPRTKVRAYDTPGTGVPCQNEVDSRSFGAVRRQNPIEAAGTSLGKLWGSVLKR
jgi:hypothetical protein